MKTLGRLSIAALFALGLSPAFAQAPPVVPALPDTPRLTSYTIAGTTCACAVNFALYGNANLADYQDWVEVFLNGVQVAYNDPTYGWAITSPTGALASISRPITDAVLTFTGVQTGTVEIVGAARPARLSQWSENQGVSARNLNVAFTGIVAQLREVWDKINDVSGRDLKSRPGNTVGLLPLPAACSNAFLGFDSTGLNPLCRVGTGSGNVVGPATSTVNHLAAFGNVTGSALLDIALGTHLSIGSSTLSTDATGTGVLATKGDIGVALPSLTTSQLYGGAGGAGVAQHFPAGTGVEAWLINPTSANLAAVVPDKTGSGSLVFANSPILVTPNLGTPSAVNLANGTNLPNSATTATSANTPSTIVARDGSGNFSAGTISAALNGNASTASAAPLSGITGLGTGVGTALGTNIGSAGAPVVNGGALGTPSGGVGTNITGVNAAQLAGTTWASPPATGYGSSTPEPAALTTLKFANLADSNTAPTITSGCGGGSPSISAPNGTDAFVVTIGTASGSTCVLGMPTATTGWVCFANDLSTHTTANSTVMQTASSASSVTVTGYSDITGTATWVSGDKIAFLCRAY